eukprot:TRINITY_DN9415_c0_g1_i1.p1 TRINITY_DN9415_c0_g1~~TRINITY_DN9415_c0_g1_i1.p1  ORF type:complete len:524 (-),score=106.39 TRINITY_DN9415_c0_g1_i1:119-1690(-)
MTVINRNTRGSSRLLESSSLTARIMPAAAVLLLLLLVALGTVSGYYFDVVPSSSRDYNTNYDYFSIDDYGAVANDSSNEAAWANVAAIEKAAQMANYSSSSSAATAGVVLVPAPNKYFIFNIQLTNLFNVTLAIEGQLVMSNNMSAWPSSSAGLYIGDSSLVTIEGGGVFDGQGYDWWWQAILGVDHRPQMLLMERCTDVLIQQLRFINSPMWHVYLHDMRDLVVRNVDVHVDVEAQREMLMKANLWLIKNRAEDEDEDEGEEDFGIPIFPLNTDGIDPSGVNVLIENVTVTNFDDAVAVKPMNGGGKYSNCSSNMLIRNIKVTYGVGMSIGSVPPNSQVNCVRGIVFDNVTFEKPFKALYVKTNPDTVGYGIIDNITYSNIQVTDALWYPIWFGPQQQHQPGTKGNGCSFFYPIVDQCETQPLVTVTNIQVVNVTMTGGVTLPGVILCNDTNPCSGFSFENVSNNGEFLVQKDYVCVSAYGTASNSNPVPPCFTDLTPTNHVPRQHDQPEERLDIAQHMSSY